MGKYTKNYKPLAVTKEEVHALRVQIEKAYNQELKNVKYAKVRDSGKRTNTFLEVNYKRNVQDNKLALTIIPHIYILGELMGGGPVRPEELCHASYLQGRLVITLTDEYALNMSINTKTMNIEYLYPAEERTERIYELINRHLGVIEEGAHYNTLGISIGEIIMGGVWQSSRPEDKGEADRNEYVASIYRDVLEMFTQDPEERKNELRVLVANSKHPVHKEWSDLIKDPVNINFNNRVNLRNLFIVGEAMGLAGEERNKVLEVYAKLLDASVNSTSKTDVHLYVAKLKETKPMRNGVREFLEYIYENMEHMRAVDFNYIAKNLYQNPEYLHELSEGFRLLDSNEQYAYRYRLLTLFRRSLKIYDEDPKDVILGKLKLACSLDNTKEIVLKSRDGMPGPTRKRGEDRRHVHLFTEMYEYRFTESVKYMAEYKASSFNYFIDRAFALLSREEACDFVRRAYNFEGVEEVNYGMPFELTFPTVAAVKAEGYRIQNSDGEMEFDFEAGKDMPKSESWKFKSLAEYNNDVVKALKILFNEGMGQHINQLADPNNKPYLGKLGEEYHYAVETFLPELQHEVEMELKHYQKLHAEAQERESKKPLNRLKRLFNRD